MNNIFTNKKIYQMLGSQGPAKRKKVSTLGEKETRQDRRAGKDNLVPSYFGSGGDDPTKTKLQRDAKKRTSDPDYKKPKAKVLKKGPAKTGDTYRKGGKKPILTAAQKEKRRQNKENSDSSSTRKYPTGNEGSNKPGGPALISGKKPKAKGKTTPNTNRLGKTLYDKGKEFLGNVAGHAIQGVKDDVKTLGKVFKRNAKRGQK